MSLSRSTLLALLLPCVLAPALPGEPRPEAPPGLDLSRHEGKVVLLDFWASWCAPCREAFPWMVEMARRYGPDGLVVVTVCLDEDPEDGAAFLEGRSLPFHMRDDPEGVLAERYGVTVMPSSILFDRKGRPAYRREGFRRKRAGEYEREIVALLEGRGPEDALAIVPNEPRRLGVRPWERGALASREMLLVSDPLEIGFDDHVYFSKEASSGGRGFGGGGCGCN